MKAVIVSGGTGGHIYPGIAIAEALLKRDISNEVLFIGSREGIEADILVRERFSFRLISSRGMLRKLSLRTFTAFSSAIRGFFQALGILKSYRPDVVVSTGGYVSFPVVAAAGVLRIPTVMHEQNTIPGITNRICQVFAGRVTVSYESSARYFSRKKTVLTGNPVREKILKAVKSVAIQKLGLDQSRKTLLVLGGSQGARRINEVVSDLIEPLSSSGVQVIHITGKRDHELVISRTGNKVLDIEKQVPELKGKKKHMTVTRYKMYHPLSYMYNIWDGLAAADLVVSRAGATSIAEIAARGLPSIIVPFPFSSENHQQENAAVLERAGAAVLVDDRNLTPDLLKGLVSVLFSDPGRLSKMSSASASLARPDASEKIVDIIYLISGATLPLARKKGAKGPGRPAGKKANAKLKA